MRRLRGILLFVALSSLPLAGLADLRGTALVMDGDTLVIQGREVSLQGIRAPAIAQSCGAAEGRWACGRGAAERLEAIVSGREVACVDLVEAADGGVLGRCAAGGEDLAGLMVDEGMAVADPESGAEYESRALAASDSGLGLWSGPFVDPVAWAERGGCACGARKKAMLRRGDGEE